jgi:hypothetical protein
MARAFSYRMATLNNLHHHIIMKSTIRTAFITGTVLAAGAAIGVLSLRAEDKKETTKPAISEEEATKRWMEAATPGAAHKVLDIWAGSWETASKMWMAPGAPPQESVGTATAAWILEGRFIEMTFKTTMMGMPFEGRAISGYNNMRKTYQGFWVDNMGTAMTISTGKLSGDGKTMTSEAKMDDPMTGKMDNTYRFIERFVSKDEIHQEIHDLSLGKDSKMMETVYKRKK